MTALSKGLSSLSYQKSTAISKYNINSDDNFLLRLPMTLQMESYVAKLGTAGIGINLLISKARTLEEADREIQ